MRPAAVTGLAAEAAIARAIGWTAVAAGGEPAGTRAAIERLVAEGVQALLSFGICGGLDPSLAPGTLVLPHAVRCPSGERIAVDRTWRERAAASLAQAGLAAASSDMIGASVLAISVADKRALFAASAAAGVDLESGFVAEAAQRRGLPFLVLRAVADPARRGLPPAARIGLGPTGEAAVGRVLWSLARAPRQLPGLVRVALDTGRALRSLRRAARALAAM
jgi:adenosylhomocysteine nucleosidase